MRASPMMPPPGFDELSPEEKLEYLQALWDRMATHPEEIPVPEWQRVLVRERLAAHERGDGKTVSWAEVRRGAQEFLRKSRK